MAVTGNSMVTNNTVLCLPPLRKCGAELGREVSSAEKGPLRDPHGWKCPWTGEEVCFCPAEWSKLNLSVFGKKK